MGINPYKNKVVVRDKKDIKSQAQLGKIELESDVVWNKDSW